MLEGRTRRPEKAYKGKLLRKMELEEQEKNKRPRRRGELVQKGLGQRRKQRYTLILEFNIRDYQ